MPRLAGLWDTLAIVAVVLCAAPLAGMAQGTITEKAPTRADSSLALRQRLAAALTEGDVQKALTIMHGVVALPGSTAAEALVLARLLQHNGEHAEAARWYRVANTRSASTDT